MAWRDYSTEIKRRGMLIALAGFAQSVKDTVAKFLINKHNFKRLAFADALREALYKLNPYVALSGRSLDGLDSPPFMYRLQEIVNKDGWDRAKTENPEIRELLQRLGTEAGREIHGQDCWTNIVKQQIAAEPLQNFVVTDMRFPNELSLINSLGGHTVRVVRDGVKSVNDHISDAYLEGVTFRIENNGTLEDLEKEVNGLHTLLTLR